MLGSSRPTECERRGWLEGNFWEVRQVKNWLCRSLEVSILESDEYVVLKGLGREYLIYTTSKECRRKGLAHFKAKLNHLFKDVVHHGRSKFSSPSISLAYKGRPSTSSRVIRPGNVYHFELPCDAAEVFSEEESWLLPVSETCTVCDDEKKLSEMPVRMTPNCEHTPSICKSCAAQWIKVTLETSTWDRIKCPECPRYLEFQDVKRYATPETFLRYDTLATKAALREIRGFRWCLSTECESGQIHDASCPKFRCATCKATHCVVHNLPWHKGETCEQYDQRHKQRRKEEKASEKEVKKSTKTCPKCKRDVHKYSGCNHITCKFLPTSPSPSPGMSRSRRASIGIFTNVSPRHLQARVVLHICFAAYKYHTTGLLYCVHKEDCPEFDPFIEGHHRRTGSSTPRRPGHFPPCFHLVSAHPVASTSRKTSPPPSSLARPSTATAGSHHHQRFLPLSSEDGWQATRSDSSRQ